MPYTYQLSILLWSHCHMHKKESKTKYVFLLTKQLQRLYHETLYAHRICLSTYLECFVWLVYLHIHGELGTMAGIISLHADVLSTNLFESDVCMYARMQHIDRMQTTGETRMVH